jgi:urease subunit gamma/beta
VRLTPWEEERLLIFTAAELGRRHRAAGIALNAPEAIALMCDAMLEAARAGGSYAEVEAAGLAAVAPSEVMPGVRELVDDVRLEVLLGDGARLIVLVDPLGRGSAPSGDGPGAVVRAAHSPGGVLASAGEASARVGPEHVGQPEKRAGKRQGERLELTVRNGSRRVVRVSSHFPFHRVNPRLEFHRAAADGFHLDLDTGSSERWAPGETRTVTLVRFGGTST